MALGLGLNLPVDFGHAKLKRKKIASVEDDEVDSRCVQEAYSKCKGTSGKLDSSIEVPLPVKQPKRRVAMTNSL